MGRKKDLTGIMTENFIDIQIGKKLRMLRNMKGISQSTLAGEAGITFQQVQKYEKGVNRIAAARLYDFACILGIDASYFFKDLDAGKASGKKYSFAEPDSTFAKQQDLLESKESLTLVREFYKIKDAAKRKHIIEIIKAMSGEK